MVMGMSTDRETNLTDATPTRNDKLTNVVLWGLVVAYVVATILRAILPNINTFPTILLLFPFTLIHGIKRYPWKGIPVFIVITLNVSGIMENQSILTGLPFGHDYYTDELGHILPHLPSLHIPSYLAVRPLPWLRSMVTAARP